MVFFLYIWSRTKCMLFRMYGFFFKIKCMFFNIKCIFFFKIKINLRITVLHRICMYLILTYIYILELILKLTSKWKWHVVKNTSTLKVYLEFYIIKAIFVMFVSITILNYMFHARIFIFQNCKNYCCIIDILYTCNITLLLDWWCKHTILREIFKTFHKPCQMVLPAFSPPPPFSLESPLISQI